MGVAVPNSDAPSLFKCSAGGLLLAVSAILALAALAGCKHSERDRQTPRIEAAEDCAEPPGWKALAAYDPDFVVFGELHGTREAPAFFGSLACNLARDGKRILIAIEFNIEDNETFQRAWIADRQRFPDILQEAASWERQDGVASEAMHSMLDELHRLRKLGYPIDIAAFNGAANTSQRARFAHLPGQGSHEAIQAENIAFFARSDIYDYVLVLVGNLHAQKNEAMLGGAIVEPMAKRLELYGRVISLNIEHRGGSAWGCRRQSFDETASGGRFPRKLVCSAIAVGATSEIQREPLISLSGKVDLSPKGDNYDGFYWVGRITSSPPFRSSRYLPERRRY